MGVRPTSHRGKPDPTQQERLAQRYAKELFKALDSLTEELIEVLDKSTREYAVKAEDVPVVDWRQLKNGFLETGITFKEMTRRSSQKATDQAYVNGQTYADKQLRVSGITPNEPAIDAVDQRALNALEREHLSRVTNMADSVREKVLETIKDDMAKGKGIEEMKRDIDEVNVTVGRQRAELIARTETIRAFNEAAKQNYIEHNVGQVEWLAAAYSDRTCDDCLDLDGKRWFINSSPMPPLHPNCRCALLPVVDMPGTEAKPVEPAWEPEKLEPEPGPGAEPKPEPETEPSEGPPDGYTVPDHVHNTIDWKQDVDERIQRMANITLSVAMEHKMISDFGVPASYLLAKAGGQDIYVNVSIGNEASNAAGWFDPKDRSIHLHSDYYRTTEGAWLLEQRRAKNAMDKMEQGIPTKLSVNGKLGGSIIHEIGHRITLDKTDWYTSAREYSRSAWGTYLVEAPGQGLTDMKTLKLESEEKIALQVSEYAASCPIEFLAETFVGMVYGRTYSNEVMAMFSKYCQHYKVDENEVLAIIKEVKENPHMKELLEEGPGDPWEIAQGMDSGTEM